MRNIIAALTVTLDGFIEGPNGELDWIESWDHPYDDLSAQVDTCLLGRGTYPGYEQYWQAILDDPEGVLPFSGKVATKDEIAYAHFAARTPHLVLSKTLKNVTWAHSRIIRDAEEIRAMKQQPGKDICAVGGAALISSLMDLGLIDELRLVVCPLILGGGRALFNGVKQRHPLTLISAKPLKSGDVCLTYRTQP